MALRGLVKGRYRSFSLITAFEDTPMAQLELLKAKKPHQTFGLPWSFTGYPAQQPMLRYMADRCLMQTKSQLFSHLAKFYDIYTQVLTSLAAGDIAPVADCLEDNLRVKLEFLLKDLKKDGKSIVVRTNQDFAKEFPKPIINVHDAVIYRGLSHKRTENEYMDNYHVFTDKDLGLVCFTHYHLSEQYAYVDQKRMQNLLNRNSLCLMQFLVHLKTGTQLEIVGRDKQAISKYDKDYTFGQEWIFESQLVPPPPMKNEDKCENYMEWIVKHQVGPWRVADMAEFMQGNPLTIKAPPKIVEEKTAQA